MTEVCIFRSRGSIVGFQAKGHTGYAEEGSDIVCSAVSVLTQSAVLGVTELLKLNAAVSVHKGDLNCMLEKDIKPGDLERAQLIFETMRLGLESVSDDYDRYLKIVEKEV
jgi:uncharacterized protein YsxB (DUF464 family)